MGKKLLTMLVLIFMECNGDEFLVVSTKEPPNELDNRLTNIENLWKDKMSELSDKLHNLETKTTLLISKTEKVLSTDNEINSINQKLQNIETHLNEIEKKVNINQINRELQTPELQNRQRVVLESTSFKQPSVIGPPKSCYESKKRGFRTAVGYFIKPTQESRIIPVLCDMETMGGGWTYILKRFNGTQNFALNWTDYKNGFGNNGGDFWLGLDNIHYLTGFQINELLVNLTDWDDKQVYAHYKKFSVDNENNGYMLNFASGYSGTAGDSFSYHEGKMFSTADKDLDIDEGNCASYWGGAGWWYGNCMHSLLTGKYWKENVTKVPTGRGMMWQGFHSNLYSLKAASMMVRPNIN